MNGLEIKRVENFKYIGLNLDSCLSWKPQVEYICSRLNRFFGVFSQLRHKVPEHLSRQIYYSTIFPVINYCLEIFGNCSAALIKKIQTKQNTLMKFLTKKDILYPTNELHYMYKILKVHDAYKLKLLSFVHSCINKTVIPLFHSYFKPHHTTHTHNT